MPSLQLTPSFLTPSEARPPSYPDYGNEPAVFWDAERDGSLLEPQSQRAFEASPRGRKLHSQLHDGAGQLAAFLQQHGQGTMVEQALRSLQVFRERLQGGSAGYYSNQIRLLQGEGKRSVDVLRAYMQDERVSLDKRVSDIASAVQGLDVCAPGAVSHLVIAAQSVMLERSGMVNHAKLISEQMLEQAILEFARQEHGQASYFANNEIHYVNGYRNFLAQRYGVRERQDDFVPPDLADPQRLERCAAHVAARVNAASLLRHLGEASLEQIQEQFAGDRNQNLSFEQVSAIYERYHDTYAHQYQERYGKLDGTLLFAQQPGEEEVYRLAENPALFMRAIAQNLQAAGVLASADFPLVAGRPGDPEVIRQVGDAYFLERRVPGGQVYQALRPNDLSIGAFMHQLAAVRDEASQQAWIRAYGAGPQGGQTQALDHAILTEAFIDGGQQAAYYLWHALQRGEPGQVAHIGERVAQASRNGLPMPALGKLLLAQDSLGTPGLYQALKQGHGQAIEAYATLAELAVRRGMPAEQLLELLLARRADGVPGLLMALHGGHAEAICAYARLMEQAMQGGLSPEQLTLLLRAQSPAGVPGLFVALQEGHARAIAGYGKLVEQAIQGGVSAEQLRQLLPAKCEGGPSGLYMALQEGHAGAIAEYAKLVELALRGASSANPLQELLLAKSDRNVTGLFMALQNGHAPALDAYARLAELWARKGVTPDPLHEWLLAKNDSGVTGLFMALQLGHAPAIEAYARLVKLSVQHGIPADRLQDLLWARSDRNVTGLFMALQNGHAAAIDAYARLVESAMPVLSGAQLQALLWDPNIANAMTGLSTSPQREAVEAYKRLVQRTLSSGRTPVPATKPSQRPRVV